MILFAFEGKIQRIGVGKGKFFKSFPKYSGNRNPKEGEVSKISKGDDKQNKINDNKKTLRNTLFHDQQKQHIIKTGDYPESSSPFASFVRLSPFGPQVGASGASFRKQWLFSDF